MKFGCATFLALSSVSGIDAFLRPLSNQISSPWELKSNPYDSEDFLNALKANSNSNDNEDETEEVSEGSSRFKALMEAAKNSQSSSTGGRAIPNPFLNPPPVTQPSAAFNIDNLSMEEQAAMLRQLMANQGAASMPPQAAPMKQKRTDIAGRPVGRNRDADSIANSADLYFAQLKRDSTVRTIARIRGDNETAQAVMADEGIRELDNLLVKNPFLQEKNEEQANFLEVVPEEALRTFFEGEEEEPEEVKTSAGIRYKEVLMQKRMRKSGSSPMAQSSAVVETPQIEPEQPKVSSQTQQPLNIPVQVVEEKQPQPEPVQSSVAEPPQVPQKTQSQQDAVEIPRPTQSTVTSYSDETRQKMRTFMGMLLKHRGGPGFGKGQLKGQEIDRFEALLGEITGLLRQEGLNAAPRDVAMMSAPSTQSAAEPRSNEISATATISSGLPDTALLSTSELTQVDSAIACIEGATTMYKNSPESIRPSILVAFRAALVSAVNTCSAAAGIKEAPLYGTAIPGSANLPQINGMITCIEGAVTMYRNSPTEVKKDVLIALRAALISAVTTCDNVIGGPVAVNSVPSPVAASAPVAAKPALPEPQRMPEPAKEVEKPQQIQESIAATETILSPDIGVDFNSKSLEGIYATIKGASGSGALGLRSDLTSSEAAALSEQLTDMRSILMQELEEGIPDPEPLAGSTTSTESSSALKYQQMLAKARAEKAAQAL